MGALKTPGRCWYDNDSASNHATFGILYNWYAVNTGKLAPAGWHVPDTAEWNTLENYLIANGCNFDGTTTGNKIAKSMAAQTDWYTGTTTVGAIGNYLSKNNSSGFSALPGGCRNYDGDFLYLSSYCAWWSATETDASWACYRDLPYYLEYLFRSNTEKRRGFSVRLLRD